MNFLLEGPKTDIFLTDKYYKLNRTKIKIITWLNSINQFNETKKMNHSYKIWLMDMFANGVNKNEKF